MKLAAVVKLLLVLMYRLLVAVRAMGLQAVVERAQRSPFRDRAHTSLFITLINSNSINSSSLSQIRRATTRANVACVTFRWAWLSARRGYRVASARMSTLQITIGRGSRCRWTRTTPQQQATPLPLRIRTFMLPKLEVVEVMEENEAAAIQ